MSTDGTSATTEGWAAGAILFAGIMLLLAGLLQIIVGLVALFNDTFYVVGQEYVFQFDLTSWGWIHLITGAVLVLVGVFVLKGALWASIAGIVIAGLSAIANFMWIPYYPVWSLLIIAVDILIIWALASHRNAITLLDS
jgi:hypothetical protein